MHLNLQFCQAAL